VTVFRRRNRKRDETGAGDEATEPGTEAGAGSAAGTGGAVGSAGAAPAATSGPWDVDDVPDDGVERIDLGALRVPTLDGTELRLEADEAGQITTVLLVSADSALQIGVFAAPRNEGIWDEIRAELRDGIIAEGGKPRETEGRHGTELHAELDTPEGHQLVRFIGYDGPRWFVRGVYSGAAGTDENAAGPLDEALSGVVVVRGGDPMPVRDPLPLRLPREVIESQHEAQQEAARRPQPPTRGPEITETR
jgi:hypothetical protein